MLRALSLLLLLTTPALAQPRAPGTDYPNRPVRVVVALAPGGNADINARLVSTALGNALGQQFIVENRPSGGGVVAMETVGRAAPDGYTLLVGALGSHALNVGLYRNLPVHPLTGLDHITISSESAMVVVAHPSTGWRSLADMRAALLARPNHYTFGSSGNGTTGHIASALLLSQMGVTAQHIPYRGSAASFADLSAGRLQFQTDTISFVEQHVRSGTVTGLAIGTNTRSPMLPDVPTAAEAGVPGFQATTWTPWSSAIGTPPVILEFLQQQIAAQLAAGPVRERILALGNTIPENMTPVRTRAFIAAEIEKWVPIVRATGATVD
ncbi:Bug family tripartite tricarboxylate transporter substrate binding protein [Sediminicoccus rosea]|jgi:tripartite-type tricarboxylate transporter receptor subunit TctC|uniref:Tripartite tricarboxylate transporter substrate-binding protein n=1 Tax=Sediminicoccus rosea TaxID=1225128 RepID=A0ABZ0PEC2_9PROT|nr:tripartite tricarboxylate transporter substrate-binding protein [Sediminicoccus rosea]WPB83975.1 tripartite tricarboxylate transporter substrate-binding protein [Sediminicoccus rosea]